MHSRVTADYPLGAPSLPSSCIQRLHAGGWVPIGYRVFFPSQALPIWSLYFALSRRRMRTCSLTFLGLVLMAKGEGAERFSLLNFFVRRQLIPTHFFGERGRRWSVRSRRMAAHSVSIFRTMRSRRSRESEPGKHSGRCRSNA